MLGGESGGDETPADQSLGPVGVDLFACHGGRVQGVQLFCGPLYDGVFLQQAVLFLKEDQLAVVEEGDVVVPERRPSSE